LLRIQNRDLLIVVSAIKNYLKVVKTPKFVSFNLCYSHCAFSYIPYFKQQNALIKAQQNISQNTLHVR